MKRSGLFVDVVGAYCNTPLRRTILFLSTICGVLLLLWLPNISYPLWADTAIYALLGRTFWTTGMYGHFGVPEGKYLPLWPLVSASFTAALGFNLGMKLASLMSGMMVLIVTYALLRRLWNPRIAAGTVLALLFHHGFVLQTSFGTSDLLFTALFLSALLLYVWAEDDPRWYLPMGIALGLACLTRYNGLALFPLIVLCTCWRRRPHLRSPLFWIGLGLGGGIFSLWLIRSALVFGNPLHTDYGAEQADRAPDIAMALVRNALYYLNPVHNVLPILLLLGLYGIVRFGKSQAFLVCAMLAAWIFTSFWWSLGVRHAITGIPLFLGFAVAGFLDFTSRCPHPRDSVEEAKDANDADGKKFIGILGFIGVLGILLLDASALCLYTYGSCNAAFDRTIGLIPADLHLTQEGMEGWDRARRFINASAPTGAAVLIQNREEAAVLQERFRPDLRVTADAASSRCPVYEIVQRSEPRGRIIFRSDAAPVTYATVQSCH